MRRINYKSDIPPLLLSLKVDEKQITVPDCDFIVRFYIEGYEGRHYDCSHIGGVWSNCEPSEDGTKLWCCINNQRLGIGELCAEFHYISPDRRYSDGSQKSVVIIDSKELGVELVEDNGDAVTEAAIDVTLPFIYRTAYEIARDHGYTGTAEDFYSALASVVAIADAEKKRVTAEITRNANEQERIENEENRLNAENERVNAEAQRVRNEAIRCDAESDRVEQEEDRKAKFVEITGFIATVRANEGNRESNELERQTNEDTRITEEAKRVDAEKKRAAEFEKQKLDLDVKIDRSGDEMGGDLIFTDNAGVSFGTSDGGEHSMFNDTDDVAKFTAYNGDTFEFKQNETPNKNSSAVVVSANLYNALDMTLDSMGSALDGDAAHHVEAGDKIFNPDTCKIQRYNSTIGGFEDLCDPIEGKLYANKMTDYIYRWNTKAKKMVFVGGVKAYTKDEADRRFAKLDDATQIVKAKELEANNSVTAKSMWIGDEGLLLGGDGNGHLTVEQDEVITDVTLNGKLATKADDVAYGVEWNNGNPTGEMQETTVKEATKNTTVTTLLLVESLNVIDQEVEKKVDKTDITQSTGTSETSVMSQKAVSDALSNVYTKAEGDAMLATKQNVLTAGNGITIADNVISVDAIPVDDKKFTVWSNPRIDEFVTTFENYGYNDDGTQKTSGSSVRSWVFKIGNYGHKKVYFSTMNAWMCDGLDDAQNMTNPTLLGKNSGNVNIGEEHIGKYIVAMSVSGYSNILGTDYCRCVMFCDEKTQAELDADERMLSDMYAGNLMRYAVATSAISDTPTLEWGNGAYLDNVNQRNILLDIVSRPNIAYECKVVKKLDYLYQGCGRLIEITPLWDTSLVTTMRSAFQMCRSLMYADLSHLDMGAVTDVYSLFGSCIALIEAKIPSLPSVTSCANMFDGCSSLQSVTLPELPLVTSCDKMFISCSSLKSATLPSLPSVTSCYQMFYDCTSLQSITLPELPLVTSCTSMFSSCSSLQSIVLPSLPSVTNCQYMFKFCSSLQSIVLPSLPSVTNCYDMFESCSSLQSITLPSLPSVTNCQYMFWSCSSLQSLYLDMPNCNNFNSFAYQCNALHTVEIVDVRKATELVNSFNKCSSLQNVTCVEELPKCAISFNNSDKLTLESVTNIITHLPDLSAESSNTLTLHATTKSLLTESLIAEATNKNWIIA